MRSYIKMANKKSSNTEPYKLQTPSNAHLSSSSNIVTQYPGFCESFDTKLTTAICINLGTNFLGVDHHYHYTSTSFQSPEDTILIQKFLNQVIHIPGDLHGGCIHFLSAICAL